MRHVAVALETTFWHAHNQRNNNDDEREFHIFHQIKREQERHTIPVFLLLSGTLSYL